MGTGDRLSGVGTSDVPVGTRHIAFLLICRECDEQNWRSGPGFPMLVDLMNERFECAGCGRTLETGDREAADG